MKKIFFGLLIICYIIFIAGCSINKELNFSETDPTLEPSPTPHSLEYNGAITYWEYELPLTMDFPTAKVVLKPPYFGESETSIGYSTIMQVELIGNESMTEKDMYWLMKEDLQCFIYIKSEDGKIDKSYACWIQPIEIDGITYQQFGNSIYFSIPIQRDERYSIEGCSLKLILHYQVGDNDITYTVETTVTKDLFCTFDIDGKCKEVGDTAADFIARKTLLVEQ